MREKLKSILSHWGFIENLDVKAEDISYEPNRESHIWTINEDYLLKMTYTKEEMVNNICLLNLLHKASIPVQQVVYTLDKTSYVQIDNKYYGLFTKIKGVVLKDYYEGNYLDRGFYLGQCIANLHDGLKKITEELKENYNIWNNNMIEELFGWVEDEITNYLPNCNLNQHEIEDFVHVKYDLEYHFPVLYDKLPKQVIHRDVHGENMIFNANKLVGYIDFDLSQVNARIFDLCYLGTGSLATIFNEVGKRKLWLLFFKSVIKGYDSKGILTFEEKQSLKYMMYAIEMIMIAYFAREGYPEIANTNIKMVNYINSVWEN